MSWFWFVVAGLIYFKLGIIYCSSRPEYWKKPEVKGSKVKIIRYTGIYGYQPEERSGDVKYKVLGILFLVVVVFIGFHAAKLGYFGLSSMISKSEASNLPDGIDLTKIVRSSKELTLNEAMSCTAWAVQKNGQFIVYNSAQMAGNKTLNAVCMY